MKARSTGRSGAVRPEDLLDEALGRPAAAADRCAGPQPTGAETESEIGALARLAAELRRLAPPPADASAQRRVWAKIAMGLDKTKAQPLSRARRSTPVARRAWRPAVAVIGLLLGVALVGASVGVAFAAGRALPGEALYPVKLGIEEARLALSPTAERDAALLLEFADERLEEAQILARQGDGARVGVAIQGYDEVLGQLMDMADSLPAQDGSGSLAGLDERLSRQLGVLRRVQGQVPPQAAEAIGAVIERAGERQAEVERIRGTGHGPDATPPGQAGRTPQPPEDRTHGPDHEGRPGDVGHGRPTESGPQGNGLAATPGSP